jgi:hypothetical protein
MQWHITMMHKLHCSALSTGHLFFLKCVTAGSFHREVLKFPHPLCPVCIIPSAQLDLHPLQPLRVPHRPLDGGKQFLPRIKVYGWHIVPMKQHMHAACAVDTFGVVLIVPEDHRDATCLDCFVHAEALQVVPFRKRAKTLSNTTSM